MKSQTIVRDGVVLLMAYPTTNLHIYIPFNKKHPGIFLELSEQLNRYRECLDGLNKLPKNMFEYIFIECGVEIYEYPLLSNETVEFLLSVKKLDMYEDADYICIY